MTDDLGTDVWEDPLLAQRASVMPPPALLPPESTVQAVRRAVSEIPPPPPVRRRRSISGWRRHPLIISALALGAVVLGTGTAFAAGVPVPVPVRNAAVAIGLPVTPQSVTDGQNATNALRQQLQGPGRPPGATAAAARQLANQYGQLSPAQKAQGGGAPHQLLHQACQSVFPGASSSASAGTGA